MTRQEVEDNYVWEQEKHDGFFLPWYEQRGWRVVRDYVGQGPHPWDVDAEISEGRVMKIDEKAIRGDGRGGVIAEFVQDLRTLKKNPRALGWMYEDFDALLYAEWPAGDLRRVLPTRLWWVWRQKLFDYIVKNPDRTFAGNSLGHGATVCTTVKYGLVEATGIGFALEVEW